MGRPATAAVRLLTGEREPCRVATTANITLSGLQTIDGVTLEAGDRVLVKNQTDATQNGIYTASEGDWYRAPDARSPRMLQKGTTVHVAEGTANASKVYVFQTAMPDIGSDPISIAFFLSDDTVNDIRGEIADLLVEIEETGDAEIAEVEAAGAPIIAAAEAARNAAQAAVASVDLPEALTPSTFLHGKADGTGREDLSYASVRGKLAVPTIVTSKAFAAALNTMSDKVAYLNDEWMAGNYRYQLGNYTARIAADPLQGVYIPADGVAENIGALVRQWDGANFWANWFGYRGMNESGVDDQPALQGAIDLMENAFGIRGASLGGVVHVPTGVAFLGDEIRLTNRVAVRGPNGRAAWWKPHSTFAGPRFVRSVNGGSSQFGCRLENLFIDARGFDMTEVILAEAWQETCGMKSVLVWMGGATQYGIHIANGYGGATHTMLEECELFSESSHAGCTGIKLSQVSLVGAFKLILKGGMTLAGDPAKPLVKAIDIVNDTLVADVIHVEFSELAINKDGAGALMVEEVNGSFNDTVDIIALASTNTGPWRIGTILPNGATGYSFRDYGGRYPSIPAADGRLASVVGPRSGFAVSLASTIAGAAVSGGYNIAFDTEDYDRDASVTSAGLFTAPKTGRYRFSGQVGVTVASGSTQARLFLISSGGNVELWRGSVNNIRDSGNTAVIPARSVVKYLTAGQTARLQVQIQGGGITTADIVSGLTFFEGEWLGE